MATCRPEPLATGSIAVVDLQQSTRYWGVLPCRHRWTVTPSLNWIRCWLCCCLWISPGGRHAELTSASYNFCVCIGKQPSESANKLYRRPSPRCTLLCGADWQTFDSGTANSESQKVVHQTSLGTCPGKDENKKKEFHRNLRGPNNNTPCNKGEVESINKWNAKWWLSNNSFRK